MQSVTVNDCHPRSVHPMPWRQRDFTGVHPRTELARPRWPPRSPGNCLRGAHRRRGEERSTVLFGSFVRKSQAETFLHLLDGKRQWFIFFFGAGWCVAQLASSCISCQHCHAFLLWYFRYFIHTLWSHGVLGCVSCLIQLQKYTMWTLHEKKSDRSKRRAHFKLKIPSRKHS